LRSAYGVDLLTESRPRCSTAVPDTPDAPDVVAALQGANARLREQNAELQAENAELKAQLAEQAEKIAAGAAGLPEFGELVDAAERR
jgi:hypothetical protein